jgi:hypothetical protein
MAKRTTKTKTETKKTKSKPVTPAIPMVNRSNSELLKERQAELTKTLKVIPPAGSTRPEGILDDEATMEARCFIPAKVCHGIIEKYVEDHKKVFQPQLRDLYAETMWAKKSQPKNPDIKVRNEAGIVEFEMQYVVQDFFILGKLVVDENQTPEEAMRQHLIVKGMKPVNAAKLVENELTWEITQTISLNAEPQPNDPLDEARTLARLKFVEYMLGNGKAPTPAEFALVLEAKMHNAKVRKGFLERAAMYASDVEELKVILTVIQPRSLNSSAKAWDNIDPAQRMENLVNKFREIAVLAADKPKK